MASCFGSPSSCVRITRRDPQVSPAPDATAPAPRRASWRGRPENLLDEILDGLIRQFTLDSSAPKHPVTVATCTSLAAVQPVTVATCASLAVKVPSNRFTPPRSVLWRRLPLASRPSDGNSSPRSSPSCDPCVQRGTNATAVEHCAGHRETYRASLRDEFAWEGSRPRFG